MSFIENKAEFEQNKTVYESAILTFDGVEDYDVYNCSIPFSWKDREYIFGRVEKR